MKCFFFFILGTWIHVLISSHSHPLPLALMPCHAIQCLPFAPHIPHFTSNTFSLTALVTSLLVPFTALPSVAIAFTPTTSVVDFAVARARFDCSVACPDS